MSMSQLSIFFDGSPCPARYDFGPKWQAIFVQMRRNPAPLFCSLRAKHDGQHVDQARGIPFEGDGGRR